MGLTPSHLEQYITSGGDGCPFCGSTGEITDGSSWDSEGGLAWQRLTCANDHTWTDVYRLSGIERASNGEIIEPPHYILISSQAGILDGVRMFRSRLDVLTAGRAEWKSITGYDSMREPAGDRTDDEMAELHQGWSPEWGGVDGQPTRRIEFTDYEGC